MAGKTGEGLSSPEGRVGYTVCRDDVTTGPAATSPRLEKGDTQPCHRPGNCPAQSCLRAAGFEGAGLAGRREGSREGRWLRDTRSAPLPVSSCAGLCRPFIYLLCKYLLRPHYRQGTEGTQRWIRHTSLPPKSLHPAWGHRHVPTQTLIRRKRRAIQEMRERLGA